MRQATLQIRDRDRDRDREIDRDRERDRERERESDMWFETLGVPRAYEYTGRARILRNPKSTTT